MQNFKWDDKSPFQGLSLTGGGYRGLFTARILQKLEEANGEPIGRRFDIISGTSIGGIISLAIAFEVPMKRVVDVFQAHGEFIFPQRKPPLGLGWLDELIHLSVPRYQTAPLKNAIVSLLPEDAVLGDATHPVLIPAMNLSKGQLEVFKTRHIKSWTRDSHYKVIDVALATSAAPTFFELAKLNGSHYADGGLFANAPDQIVVHEAQHFLGVPDAAFKCLSIGTITNSYSVSKSEGRNFGGWKWLKKARLVSAMISAQQQFVNQIMKHRYTGFHRIDYELPPGSDYDLELDSASFSVQQLLIELADEVMTTELARSEINSFLAHQPQLKIL